MTAENDSGVQTHIGAAGWQLPKEGRERFPEAGSHLQRYSRVLNAVEINSTSKGSHQPSTYEKWAGAVPEGFAFAVNVSREITHQRMLVDVERRHLSWGELVYYGLHGSPKIYYSSYDDAFLAELAQRLDEHSRHAHEVWCIFDNTAAGAGTHNAVDLLETLRGQADVGRA